MHQVPLNVVRDLLQRELVSVPLSPKQMDALTLWATDVLAGEVDGLADGLVTTKLLWHVNRREFHAASAEFLRWCMKKGRYDARAHEKRIREHNLFLEGLTKPRIADTVAA